MAYRQSHRYRGVKTAELTIECRVVGEIGEFYRELAGRFKEWCEKEGFPASDAEYDSEYRSSGSRFGFEARKFSLKITSETLKTGTIVRAEAEAPGFERTLSAIWRDFDGELSVRGYKARKIGKNRTKSK